MPVTVRFVSDGEEMVLSEGEAFRLDPNEDAPDSSRARRDAAAAPQPSVRSASRTPPPAQAPGGASLGKGREIA
jgi:hypothetical protein